MRAQLSYANVMATLAVVIAVAGGSTAIAVSASKAPKNSVRTNSIVNRAITAKKLKQVKGVSQSRTFTGPGTTTATAQCPAGALAIDGSAGVTVGAELLSVGAAGPSTAWSATATSTTPGQHQLNVTAWCLPAK